jgi:hypothetical protein
MVYLDLELDGRFVRGSWGTGWVKHFSTQAGFGEHKRKEVKKRKGFHQWRPSQVLEWKMEVNPITRNWI